MKVIIFGATGMVGQGALRECLLNPAITQVATVGRTLLNQNHPKLKEIVHKDLWNYQSIESELSGYDACFFCLGTPSAGKTEAEYVRVTYDLTLAAAKVLSRLNPQMTFIYISGDGADSSEKSKVMWARVRGKTENDLMKLPFKQVFIFRPGIIRPMHGIQSKTKLYRVFYSLSKPLLPILRALFPSLISSTEQIGQALIKVAQYGYSQKILKAADFEKVIRKAIGKVGA